jgi:hypothetical protein
VPEQQGVAQLGQHAPLEPAQHRSRRRAVAQRRQRRLVVQVQAFVRIVARRQLEHQLVQVEPADQRQPRERIVPAARFRAMQRLQLALARP